METAVERDGATDAPDAFGADGSRPGSVLPRLRRGEPAGQGTLPRVR